jgi:hypothetical protein
VARGSNGVGGLAYQLLAVFLTYVCICFAWVPDMAEALGKPRSAPTEANANSGQGEIPSALEAAPPDASEERPMPAVIRWPLAMAVSLILPFSGQLGVLGLLIAAFGLWEAWRRNKKVPLDVAGPFSLASSPPVAVPANAGG